jgi:hypothetical protein
MNALRSLITTVVRDFVDEQEQRLEDALYECERKHEQEKDALMSFIYRSYGKYNLLCGMINMLQHPTRDVMIFDFCLEMLEQDPRRDVIDRYEDDVESIAPQNVGRLISLYEVIFTNRKMDIEARLAFEGARGNLDKLEYGYLLNEILNLSEEEFRAWNDGEYYDKRERKLYTTVEVVKEYQSELSRRLSELFLKAKNDAIVHNTIISYLIRELKDDDEN